MSQLLDVKVHFYIVHFKMFFRFHYLSCTETFHSLTVKEAVLSNASIKDPLMPVGMFCCSDN